MVQKAKELDFCTTVNLEQKTRSDAEFPCVWTFNILFADEHQCKNAYTETCTALFSCRSRLQYLRYPITDGKGLGDLVMCS